MDQEAPKPSVMDRISGAIHTVADDMKGIVRGASSLIEQAGESMSHGSVAETAKETAASFDRGKIAQTAESGAAFVKEKGQEAAKHGDPNLVKPVSEAVSETAESFEKGEVAQGVRNVAQEFESGRIAETATKLGEGMKNVGRKGQEVVNSTTKEPVITGTRVEYRWAANDPTSSASGLSPPTH